MILDDRCQRICQLLVTSDTYMSVEYLSEQLNVSSRSIYSDLENISHLFLESSLPSVQSVRNKGVYLTQTQKEWLKIKLASRVSFLEYSAQERHHLLICHLIGNTNLKIENLQSLTQVSRNTVFNDLKYLRSQLNIYDLQLHFNPKQGYVVVGSELNRRSLFIYHAIELLELEQASVFDFIPDTYSDILMRLKTIENLLNTEFVKGTLKSLAMLLSLVEKESFPEITIDIDKDQVLGMDEYLYIREYFPFLIESEVQYFAIHLLGSRTQILTSSYHVGHYIELSVDLIRRFENLSAVSFNNVFLLVKQLSSHLAISHIRYRYGLHHNNMLLDEIKSRFKDIYDLSDQALDVVRERLRVPISDGEVGFIALHFNNFIFQKQFKTSKARVVVVCPQGIATSSLLKRAIEAMSSSIEVTQLLSLNMFDSLHDLGPVDLIVSTVHIETEYPYLKVNPVLSSSDTQAIMQRLPVDYRHQADDLMRQLSPYVNEKHYSKVKSIVGNFLNPGAISFAYDESMSLLDLMSDDMIQVSNQELDYKEAISLAAFPLLEQGYIEATYIDRMISSLEELGPYTILDGGYMIAHASLDSGVNRLGLSFLKLSSHITFKDKRFNKVFVLAPCDQHQHLGIMKDIMHLLVHEDFNKRIDSLVCIESIYEEITRVLSLQRTD